MPEDYSVQRGRDGGWDGVDRRRRDDYRWDGRDRRRGGGRRWYDRRRRRPRYYYLPFPFIFGHPRYRCDWYDRYGRCCDRYGRCYYRDQYPRYYPMGNSEMDWEEAQMNEPMLMAGADDDMYYEE